MQMAMIQLQNTQIEMLKTQQEMQKDICRTRCSV